MECKIPINVLCNYQLSTQNEGITFIHKFYATIVASNALKMAGVLYLF